MDPVRKQLRQRLDLEQILGAASLPRLNRLPPPEEPTTAPADAPAAEETAQVERAQPAADDPSARALAALEAEAKHCRKCPLCQGRTHVVFGEGHPHAPLVFVGEAPGRDEDAQGRPFVGRAGQLLNDIITKGMKLTREDVYIGNVLKCRPPQNRTPQPDEIAECLPYLLRQLELIGPKVVVALGACAAQGLLQTTESVGRLRGQVHELQLVPMGRPVPVIVTYHPAYLLRNYSPDARRKVWDDIRTAMKIAGIPIPPRK